MDDLKWYLAAPSAEADPRKALEPDHVHVWRARLDQPAPMIAALADVLSEDERARAARFRADSHRDRFIVCRAAQRDILGAYAGIAPESIAFEYSAHGKPSLDIGAEHARGIRFNTSNSSDLAVFAVAVGRELGIDVEAERTIADVLSLARRFFSPVEFEALSAIPAESMHRAFLTCWTRKEAFVKAVGLGVSMPLDRFDVPVRPQDPAALLCTRPDASVAGRWSMHSLNVGPGYVGTVVIEGTIDALHLLDWQPPTMRQ
ncbi:MAG: 4'-phosphopantetheinyl transferase family protein [Longimicrobiales bacterium]